MKKIPQKHLATKFATRRCVVTMRIHEHASVTHMMTLLIVGFLLFLAFCKAATFHNRFAALVLKFFSVVIALVVLVVSTFY